LIEIHTPCDIDTALKYVDKACTDGLKVGDKLCVYVGEKPPKGMTTKQRGALHIWCELFATALNDAGKPRKKVLFNGDIVDVDWNMIMFKEEVYKPMLLALSGKISTEKQNTVDPSDVANHINRHIGQTYGVTVGWPSNR